MSSICELEELEGDWLHCLTLSGSDSCTMLKWTLRRGRLPHAARLHHHSSFTHCFVFSFTRGARTWTKKGKRWPNKDKTTCSTTETLWTCYLLKNTHLQSYIQLLSMQWLLSLSSLLIIDVLMIVSFSLFKFLLLKCVILDKTGWF